MNAYAQYVRSASDFTRISLVGPTGESKTVLEALYADGWRVTRSGPYTDEEMFPRVDMTRFLFNAERQITD